MKNLSLICTQCEKQYPISRSHPRCDTCGEPLAVEMVRGRITEGNILTQTVFERYGDFFPFERTDRSVSLREGFTPLIESPTIARALGIRCLLFKNETQNPTWSFKDRGTVVALRHAVALGYDKIGTVSSGNMAVSVAAYGARAGLKTFTLVSGNIPSEKLNPIAMYNPVLIAVDGDYGDLYFRSLELGRQHAIFFLNSDVPFRVEGSKTIAFELCEQLNFTCPDYVIVPTSSGGNIRGILKGFEEFRLCGLIDAVPKMVCAQAEGCAPIHEAYTNNSDCISRVLHPNTIAHAIENPYPPSGNDVLRKIREHGGTVTAVNDEEIVNAQRELAGEGIFGQPASAVSLAALKKLLLDDVIKEDDSVVCIVTGSGLKYTAAFEKHRFSVVHAAPDDLDRVVST